MRRTQTKNSLLDYSYQPRSSGYSAPPPLFGQHLSPHLSGEESSDDSGPSGFSPHSHDYSYQRPFTGFSASPPHVDQQPSPQPNGEEITGPG